MKIKTEILQSIYILTCDGSSLTPSVIEVFLNAMKVMIQKNNLDILFDLSAVEAVEGAKIGAIARFLETIEGHGHLIICGVNERDLNLLKMSHLAEIFLQATNRNEALNTLLLEKKKAPKPVPPSPPEPVVVKEEAESPLATEKPESCEIPEEDDGDETVYEIEYADVEIVEVVSDDLPTEEGEPASELEAVGVEDTGYRPLTEKERRKFCSIKSRKFMDGEFIVFCKNSVTGKHHTAIVENIGPGGLFMTLSPPTISEGEELFIEGRIGKFFKFKEKVVLHSRHQDKFAFEFVDLSSETTRFLNRLVAS